jgi:hypothetical protein
MSIVVRYNPPSLTAEQYDEGDRRLREAGVELLPDGLEYHVCFGSDGNLRVSEIWDSREQFEAYGERLSLMPVLADLPFDSGAPPRGLRGSQDPQALKVASFAPLDEAARPGPLTACSRVGGASETYPARHAASGRDLQVHGRLSALALAASRSSVMSKPAAQAPLNSRRFARANAAPIEAQVCPPARR